MRLLLALSCLMPLCAGADLILSRPARPNEFLDAVGSKAGIWGREDGTLEAWVYPLKIVKDLRLEFRVEGRVIPAALIVRRVVTTPGATAIHYSGDEFQVIETLIAPFDQAGVLVQLQISAQSPVEVAVRFARDFQLMWPASIGTSYLEWDEKQQLGFFGADGHPYAAVLGSPDAKLESREYLTNYSTQSETVLSLGVVKGNATRSLAIAGSLKDRAEALAVYRQLIADPAALRRANEQHALEYLRHTVQIAVPDERLQAAYDWSRLSLRRGLVNNPLLGQGLVAGFGPSKGVYRPGFAWFFGRDSFWSSLALTADGDYATARAAIAFIAKYQRADGKVPHEIAQSASLVPWFDQFPYAYASADATPLFLIAVRDYVEASGDETLAEELWPKLVKAMQFMQSTADPADFPRNLGIGHGWVEGGPLLPVRTEYYQAALSVEAWRSMGVLTGLRQEALAERSLRTQAARQQQRLEELYWLPAKQQYAFGIDEQGRPSEHASVLTTVAQWFDLPTLEHGQAMNRTLATAAHTTDWGMRIIANDDPLFGPAGYHFGSVWPLFTGWASVGQYRYHQPQQGWANLQANAWLALDGANGNTTEVLSGAAYSPLSTASPHQIWSAAMVVSPVLRGLFGLSVIKTSKRITLAPHIPADWNFWSLREVAGMDLHCTMTAQQGELQIQNRTNQTWHFSFQPSLSPVTKVSAATFDRQPSGFQRVRHGAEDHVIFDIELPPGTHLLRWQTENPFGLVYPRENPELGADSQNLKVINEEWSAADRRLTLTLDARPDRRYVIQVPHPTAMQVTGAELAAQGRSLILAPTQQTPGPYAQRTVRMEFSPRYFPAQSVR